MGKKRETTKSVSGTRTNVVSGRTTHTLIPFPLTLVLVPLTSVLVPLTPVLVPLTPYLTE
jgi:hypothetical protein